MRGLRSAPAKNDKPPVWAVLVFLSEAEDLNAEKSVRQGAAGRREYAGQRQLKGDAGRERSEGQSFPAKKGGVMRTREERSTPNERRAEARRSRSDESEGGAERNNRSAPAKNDKPPVWAVLVFLSEAEDLRQKINIC